jgi:hypothetical protein
MKKYLLISCFLVYTLCAASFAHNLNITDYNTTISGAKLTRLDFGLNNNSSADFDKNPTSSNSTGSLDLNHYKFYDSLDKSWSYGLTLGHNEASTNGSLSSRTNNYQVQGEYNVYFLPEQNIYQGVSGSYDIENNRSSAGSNYENTTTSVGYQIGIGHVIDLSPLAEAGVLEDRLMEAGMLKKNLSKDDMLKLAEIIRKYRMDEYDMKSPDTAKGRFLRDLGDVLSASKLLTRPLGGFAFWRISEYRYVNYARTKGMQLEIATDSQYHIDDNYNTPSHSFVPVDTATISLRSYWPLDWRNQVNLTLSYASAMSVDSRVKDGAIPQYTSLGSISWTYDLTNSLWSTIGVSMERYDFYEDIPASDFNSIKFYDAALNYKIEDFSTISLGYQRVVWDDGFYFERFAFSQSIYFN